MTIATFGNATDFGNLSQVNYLMGAASSQIRGLFINGYAGSPLARVNTIEYVTIATTGNVTDFGDMPMTTYNPVAFSDAHGGLG